MAIKKLFIAAIVVAGALIFPANMFADPINDAPSTKKPATIGSWSDEYWSATGFYQLVPCGGGNEDKNFCYVGTSNPTANMNDYSVSEGNTVSITPDLVVTEWTVTGHVHFASGL
ncbi:MAG: hypothetical protein WCS77_05355 [Elusimicrobiaceae bacterium]